ncbi:MAG: branched-chain amino acid ABC transporter permease [Clostridia bacterium]|nr:branched-chain amino acid ABC transporter permease [Clostridia bacterium]
MASIFDRMKKVRWDHYIDYILIAVFALVLTVLSMTGNLKNSSAIIVEKIAISMILAVSLSLVVGFLGELSLGHAGFMCVGAYIGGKLSIALVAAMGNTVFAVIISMLVGGLCAAACGFLVGLPALRLKGDYLAIVTLAFGEIVKVIFQQSATFGGNLGLGTPRYDKRSFFIIELITVIITLAAVQNLIRSKHGRAITAIRDNEIAAKATGINVTGYKLAAFMISSFFAGVAGVLFSFSNSTIQATKFGYNYSIEILVIIVLGGMGSLRGSLISAALITLLNEKLRTILTGDLAVMKDLVYAVVLIAVVIYNNAPALKSFRDKYNLRRVFDKIRNPKQDHAFVRDDDAAWDRVPTKIKMDELLSVDIVPGNEFTPDKPSKGGQ